MHCVKLYFFCGSIKCDYSVAPNLDGEEDFKTHPIRRTRKNMSYSINSHRAHYYLPNDDPMLILTYRTARSHLVFKNQRLLYLKTFKKSSILKRSYKLPPYIFAPLQIVKIAF